MMRVVLDTNVLTAAYRSRNGASFVLLQMAGARKITPLVSVALFLEYEAVLKRPMQMAEHGLSISDIDKALSGFLTIAEVVETHFQWRPQLSDAKDELVLEAAVNGRAEALITHNMRDFDKAAFRFGLTLVKPSDFLERLRA